MISTPVPKCRRNAYRITHLFVRSFSMMSSEPDCPNSVQPNPIQPSPSPMSQSRRAPFLWFALLAAFVALGLWATRGSQKPLLTAPVGAAEQKDEKKKDERKKEDKKVEQADKPAKKEAKAATKKGAKKPKDEPAEIENPFPRRFKLEGTELDGGIEWLNASGPITLKDLRGKVVILDFWTYCCINCMHILPDLKYLEQKYPKELIVIGVHSAKFDNEKETENIRRAALRYEIEHPIVNDAEMKIWRSFGIRAWPSIALIDPEGYFCGTDSGEGHRELLDEVVGRVVAYHRAKGTLDETPVKFDLERNRVKPGALRFPGKVLADEASNRLFITDSNHNRIVVTSLDGKLLDVIGNGAAGATDGDYKSASFFRPQGTELVGEKLYVSDTENHLLRVVDLAAKKVTTLAGTGVQAQFRASGGALRKTALNSPWSLSHVDGTLYVAMAGPHQLWAHKLGSDTINVFAGSGREDIIDGPNDESAFAQPSGIASDGKAIYVADSEGSSIRRVGLDSKSAVTTVVGTSELRGGRLFVFGDRDGQGLLSLKEQGQLGDKDDVVGPLLQHPLDVAVHNGTVFIADSYNHKIKRLDVAKRDVKTVVGTGKAGAGLSPAQLSEPGGVSAIKGKLYIADTNNHRVCVVDLKSGAMTELKIDGLQPPPAPKESEIAGEAKGVTEVAAQSLAAGDKLTFEVRLKLPEGYKLNKLDKVRYKLEASGEQALIAADQLKVRHAAEEKDGLATFSVPTAKATGDAKLLLSVSFSYCRDGVGGVCKLNTTRWNIPVKLAEDGKTSSIKLEATAE
jgi:thiol-disulfide isomerase/thioredoxin/DNA-binding beta-propeller fold protein YncE